MTRSLLTERVNTYFSLLFITALGAVASLIIIHIASESVVEFGLATVQSGSGL